MPEVKVNLPMEWHIDEQIVPQYANNIAVQLGDNEVIVSFFRTLPPLLVGTPEEIDNQLEKTKSVRAECVAQLIIPPSRIQTFVGVLQQLVEKISDTDPTSEEVDDV